MTQHDRLIENYEDAFFSLFMEKVSDEEGKRFIELNKQLKCDSTYELPPKLHSRSLKTIRSQFTKEKKKAVHAPSRRIVRRIALVALIAMLLATMAIAFSPTLRNKALTLAKSMFKTHTEITVTETQQESAKSKNLQFGWIPSGYKCTDCVEKEYWVFQSSQSKWIQVNIWDANAENATVDTEDALVKKEIKIGNQKGFYTKKAKRNQLTWQYTANGILINISSSNLSEKELVKFAKNITSK